MNTKTKKPAAKLSPALAFMRLRQLVANPPRLEGTKQNTRMDDPAGRWTVSAMHEYSYRKVTRKPRPLREALLILRRQLNQHVIDIFELTDIAMGDPDADMRAA